MFMSYLYRSFVKRPIIFISFFIFILCSCKEEKVYRIGVSQCSDDDWRAKMNEEINREMFLHNNAEVEIRSADDNSLKQIEDIKYFAENDFDIIIVAPNEADALTPIIKEVYESEIPVLVFDRNINGDTYTAFQGADNVAIGQAAAEFVGNLVDNHAYIIEIQGLRGSTPTYGRHQGFHSIADTASSMTVLGTAYGNWEGPKAGRVVDSLLKLYPETNLIYAHNDRMAIAAAEKAREAGLENIKIIGIDAAPEIGIKAVADGTIDASFIYPTEGSELIRTALKILEGKPFERNLILPVTSVVDNSNAEILLLQNKSLQEETSKINNLKGMVDEYWDRHSAQTTILYGAIIIVILLFILIFALLRAFWARKKHEQQLQEATQSKLMFFTNVSHDLRTPLTLIAGPVEQLATATNLTPEQSVVVGIAQKNVKILMRLINQILDFRKYENGKLDLNLAEANLSALLREWADSFRDAAKKRNIDFTLDIPENQDIITAIDIEKVERVMFNLISNAFKYTPAKGRIAVSLAENSGRVIIRVSDSGKGISAEDLSHIFERFFQVEKVHPNGSGIGLSLAKAFIDLHGGSLEADSEIGKGSVFTVTLPVRHVEGTVTSTGSNITAEDVRLEVEEIIIEPKNIGDDKTTVLVIDDNSDIRALVSTLLKDDYLVLTAPDGAKGLKMAAKYVPDLIICDVMMPVMDGLECCRRLKAEPATSHIPVLMLTACSMDEQRIQGYECGADGYLSKPFNAGVLLARCRSLIENRRRIKSLWPSLVSDTKPERPEPADKKISAEAGVGDIDSEFYNRFCKIVEKNISDPDMSVDGIAAEMGLGRSQFYRKIKALTNYSPVELLRNMRLAKARTLLTSTEKSVSEIAYEVGFTTPAYFGKCYKDRYNETPTEIRERLKK